MPAPDLDAAYRFLVANARVLDRRLFERLFADGPAAPVRDAVLAHRNDDGGFGHALEPDVRAPESQPLSTWTALQTLHDADAWDDDVALAAADFLDKVAPPEGGASMALESADRWPRAPWMAPSEGPAMITTGLNASILLARGIEHPWLDRSTDLIWSWLEPFGEGHPYVLRALLAFLENVPDRDRARRAYAEQLAPQLERPDVVALDPGAEGEVHGPLDYAPRPDSISRPAFDDATIEAHLDHLADAQQDDGGWTFNWQVWSPAAASDTRGAVTVDNLRTLRAYGRVS
jgi:hypothetical protein